MQNGTVTSYGQDYESEPEGASATDPQPLFPQLWCSDSKSYSSYGSLFFTPISSAVARLYHSVPVRHARSPPVRCGLGPQTDQRSLNSRHAVPPELRVQLWPRTSDRSAIIQFTPRSLRCAMQLYTEGAPDADKAFSYDSVSAGRAAHAAVPSSPPMQQLSFFMAHRTI